MTLLSTPDGRHLDVSVSGPDGGTPLVFHHGTPGSLTPLFTDPDLVHRRGLRLVSFSRPGYGGSTRLPGRRVVDVVADVATVLDHLGAPRCLVAGWSGGGPHALASAARLPERVAGALVIAGVVPYEAPGCDFLAGMGQADIEEFGRAVRGERALRPFLRAEAAGLRAADADGLRRALTSLLPEADRAALTGTFARQLAAHFTEGLRCGVDGWLDDDLCFVRPWGFEPADITVPVFLWHGDADLTAPQAHTRWLADRIPTATAHLVPGEGHLSVAQGAFASMLDELAATL